MRRFLAFTVSIVLATFLCSAADIVAMKGVPAPKPVSPSSSTRVGVEEHAQAVENFEEDFSLPAVTEVLSGDNRSVTQTVSPAPARQESDIHEVRTDVLPPYRYSKVVYEDNGLAHFYLWSEDVINNGDEWYGSGSYIHIYAKYKKRGTLAGTWRATSPVDGVPYSSYFCGYVHFIENDKQFERHAIFDGTMTNCYQNKEARYYISFHDSHSLRALIHGTASSNLCSGQESIDEINTVEADDITLYGSNFPILFTGEVDEIKCYELFADVRLKYMTHWHNNLKWLDNSFMNYTYGQNVLKGDKVVIWAPYKWTFNGLTQYGYIYAHEPRERHYEPTSLSASVRYGYVSFQWSSEDKCPDGYYIEYEWNKGGTTMSETKLTKGQTYSLVFDHMNGMDGRYRVCANDGKENWTAWKSYTLPKNPYIPQNLKYSYSDGLMHIGFSFKSVPAYYTATIRKYINGKYVALHDGESPYFSADDSCTLMFKADVAGDYEVDIYPANSSHQKLGYERTHFSVSSGADYTPTDFTIKDEDRDVMTLGWKSSADKFDVEVYDDKGETVYATTTTANKLSVNIKKDGYFRFSVRAYNDFPNSGHSDIQATLGVPKVNTEWYCRKIKRTYEVKFQNYDSHNSYFDGTGFLKQSQNDSLWYYWFSYNRYEGDFLYATAQPFDYVKFCKWSNGSSSQGILPVVTGDQTYTAYFRDKRFHLAVNHGDGGVVYHYNKYNRKELFYGDYYVDGTWTEDFWAVPARGYKFAYWYVSGDNINKEEERKFKRFPVRWAYMNGNKHFMAFFRKLNPGEQQPDTTKIDPNPGDSIPPDSVKAFHKTYTIWLRSSNDNLGMVMPMDSVCVEEGESLEISALPKDGTVSFILWLAKHHHLQNASEPEYVLENIHANDTITALFQRKNLIDYTPYGLDFEREPPEVHSEYKGYYFSGNFHSWWQAKTPAPEYLYILYHVYEDEETGYVMRRELYSAFTDTMEYKLLTNYDSLFVYYAVQAGRHVPYINEEGEVEQKWKGMSDTVYLDTFTHIMTENIKPMEMKATSTDKIKWNFSWTTPSGVNFWYLIDLYNSEGVRIVTDTVTQPSYTYMFCTSDTIYWRVTTVYTRSQTELVPLTFNDGNPFVTQVVNKSFKPKNLKSTVSGDFVTLTWKSDAPKFAVVLYCDADEDYEMFYFTNTQKATIPLDYAGPHTYYVVPLDELYNILDEEAVGTFTVTTINGYQQVHLTVVGDAFTTVDEELTGYYDKNTVVTLEAECECIDGFYSWSDGVQDNPRTVVLTKDTVIRAISRCTMGVEIVEAAKQEVYASGNKVFFNLQKECAVSIYAVDGKLVARIPSVTHAQVMLPTAGTYSVVLHPVNDKAVVEKTYKLVIY